MTSCLKFFICVFLLCSASAAGGSQVDKAAPASPQPLFLNHAQSGEALTLDPAKSPLVILSTPCKPCQSLVKEVLGNCPEVKEKLYFVGIGSRSALRKAFPKIQDSLWLSQLSPQELQIKGTPTFLFQEQKILGLMSCAELLKQTSLFK